MKPFDIRGFNMCESLLRVPQKQNFQSKNKRIFWSFPTEIVQNTLTIQKSNHILTNRHSFIKRCPEWR